MPAVELIFVAILIALWLLDLPPLHRIAAYPKAAFALCFCLPILLRLLLLFRYPIPAPHVSDDFVQILSADTLLHFRLANPPHPLSQFFETFFTLQSPAYAAMFPLGQGLLLALGKLLTGNYWAGIALSAGAFAATCYWMLRAWTSPGWALVGGILTGIQFGPLCEWMNSYWGGSLAATAGCLILGSLPRLRAQPNTRYAILLGTGLALHALTRPFESVFLAIAVLAYILHARIRPYPALIPLAAMLVFTLFHNHAVTGQWTQLPYQLSQYQYGVPSTMSFLPNPEPHRELTREQQLVVLVQKEKHGDAETPSTYFQRLAGRIRYLRFFVPAPLYLALPFFLPALRRPRYFWIAATLALVILGSNFYAYFYPHYIAGITGLFVLITVTGLSRMPAAIAPWIVRVSLAHFLFWYGVLAFATPATLAALQPFATWHVIRIGDPEARIAIRRQLESTPGRHVVFVRYSLRHTFREWVHNAADIDASRIVWARDLGPNENAKLLDRYPDRKAWLLEPDAYTPRLQNYAETTKRFQIPSYTPGGSQNGSR